MVSKKIVELKLSEDEKAKFAESAKSVRETNAHLNDALK
jgi:malate/lactate dehydrogenase